MKTFINFVKGVVLRGESSDPTDNTPGSIWHNSTVGRLRAYIQGAVREVVSTDQTQTLTNKSVDASTNTLTNITDSSIAAAAAILRSKLANGTANAVVINNGSGVQTDEPQLAKVRGGTGADNSAVTFPSTGVIVTEAGTETLTNKTLTSPVIGTIVNTGTLTLPTTTDTLVGRATTDTLTNKTLTSPVINTPTGIVKGDVGLGNVDNTSDATKNAASVTLTNKKLDDSTTSIVDTADNTKTIKFDAGGTTSTGTTITAAQTANRVLTLPDATDTLAGLTAAQTISNKQIDVSNTIVVKATQFTLQDATTGTNTVKFLTNLLTGPVNQTIPNNSGVLLNDSNTATVSNKTLTEPKVTLGVDYEIQSSLTNTVPSGYKRLYPKTDGKFYQLDSSGVETVIGGSAAGGINYILNPDAETSTTGWATYADAAGTTPVDGTGGVPNVTWTRVTSSPLRGNASFLLTKDAANRQGQGASYDFTVDSADQGKVLQISADYIVASGTYLDGDLGVYIYDKTNSVLLYPSVSSINNSSINSKINVTFQTNSNSTSYRLILHCQSTSASAYTVKMDNFVVGPQTVSMGPAMSDWKTYSPTVSGFGTGFVTFQSAWRRVGDSMEIRAHIGSGTSPTGTPYVSLPAGYVVDDTGKISSTVYTIVGEVIQDSQTVTVVPITISGETRIYFGYFSGSGATGSNPQQAIPPSVNNSLIVSVPIKGWSAGAALSSDLGDNRVVRSTVRTSSSVSYGNTATKVQFNTIDKDSHGTFDPTTNFRYTVPVSGTFEHQGVLNFGVAGALLTTIVYLYKNGSQIRFVQLAVPSGASFGIPFTFQDDAVAGDYYEIFVQNSTASSNSSTNCYWNISKISSGSQQIAATETIAATYGTNSTQSIPGSSNTTIVFDVKDFDSHNGMNTSTGVYTVPANGKYRISSNIRYANSLAWTLGSYASINVVKNGSVVRSQDTAIQASATLATGPSANMSTTVNCLAGDTLVIKSTHGEGTNRTLIGSAALNWVSIERVGN